MKIKTILGVIACAGACASFSAFANTTNAWFSATPSGSELTLTTTVTTNGAAVTVAGGLIELDLEKDDALVFTPTADSDATSDGLVTLSAHAVLTPCDVGDFEAIGDAKTGFAVGVDNTNTPATTNFYGYVAGGWLPLSGTVPGDVETTAIDFKLELNYRDGKVKFFVYNVGYLTENSTNEFNLANSATTLASVDVWGSGKLGTVASSFEVATVAVGDKKYGSVADAIAAGGAEATIKDVLPSGAIATETPTVADNGMSVAVCKALGLSTTDSNAKVTVVPAGNDTDASNVTLALSDADAAHLEPGLVVKFAVKLNNEPVTGSPFAQDAIKVPCATGIYTVEPVAVQVAP